MESSIRLEIVLSPSQTAAFNTALTEDFDSIACALAHVDAENATAWKKEDKDAIFAKIITGCGFNHLNATVLKLLREWLAKVAIDNLDALAPDSRAASVVRTAEFLLGQGLITKALPRRLPPNGLCWGLDIKRRLSPSINLPIFCSNTVLSKNRCRS